MLNTRTWRMKISPEEIPEIISDALADIDHAFQIGMKTKSHIQALMEIAKVLARIEDKLCILQTLTAPPKEGE